jgi:hypothetical protein
MKNRHDDLDKEICMEELETLEPSDSPLPLQIRRNNPPSLPLQLTEESNFPMFGDLHVS